MNNLLRKVALVLLVSILIVGCGRVRQLWAQPSAAQPAANRGGLAAAPGQELTPDDSICRWSQYENWGGGGGGEEYIEPVTTASDAIVGELQGVAPAFSADGTLVATVDGDQVRVWRADDGSDEFELPGDAFAFNPDGSSIAVRQDEEWYLWDLATEVERYRVADSGRSLIFSADGSTFATLGETEPAFDGSVHVYTAEDGTQLLALSDTVLPVALSADGSMLAVGKANAAGPLTYESIALWDTANASQMQELAPEIQSYVPLAGIRGHYLVTSLAFSPDGKTLLSAGPDAVRLWDTAGGTHLRCFQTPDHQGAAQAVWGVDTDSIAGTGATTLFPPLYKKEIYFWDVGANRPTAMVALDGRSAPKPAEIAVDSEGGRLLAWSAFNIDDTGDRRAYLWDLATHDLVAVLPTAGALADAALGTDDGRAVTVSTYNEPPGTGDTGTGDTGTGDTSNDTSSDTTGDSGQKFATLLWDTQHKGVAQAAAALANYEKALQTAIDGKPRSAQARYLRSARALSPELMQGIEQISEDDKAAYAQYLARKGQMEALADGSGPEADAFTAEIRDDTPKWRTWEPQDLAAQVAGYVSNWGVNDPEGAVRAYQEFAALDPDTARIPTVIDVLVNVLAPDAAARIDEGDVDGAAALIQDALVSYPDLAIDPATAARHLYANSLLQQGTGIAYGGDTAGAVAVFDQALAQYPDLTLDPQAQADRTYAQVLIGDGAIAAAEGDFATGLAKFAEALNLDAALAAQPPDYMQVFCALRPDVAVTEDADTLCATIDLDVTPITLGQSVTGTLEAATPAWDSLTTSPDTHDGDFWSVDVDGEAPVTVDLGVDHSRLFPDLMVYGPDGVALPEVGGAAADDLRLDMVLPQAGHYLIGVVTDYNSGDYWLSLTAPDANG